jgi:hypothetical protein
MRQAMTAEVRPDEGQATSSGASGRSADDLLADTSQRRSNSLQRALIGRKIAFKSPGNLGNVGTNGFGGFVG